jgi:hypothetical protein
VERVAEVAPWEFMSDLELIGVRDEGTGQLYIASVLGTLGTLFAIVIYRNDAGLRWIHEVATKREEPDLRTGLEEMDCLKIEWCRRKELQVSDLKTLEAAGFKPKGRGPVWPRFESSRPGWYPWAMNDEEARLLTGLLGKVMRFVRLREISGPLHEEPCEAELPIVPAGEESTLRSEEIEWVPFVPPPAPPVEPVALSNEQQQDLARLPVRKDFIAEVIAPLTIGMSFVDEQEKRPCLARVPLIVDHASGFIFATEIAHGAAPLRDALGPALVKALRNAKARPARIHVDEERMAAALRPAGETIGVPVVQAPLERALHAWLEMEGHFRRQRH